MSAFIYADFLTAQRLSGAYDSLLIKELALISFRVFGEEIDPALAAPGIVISVQTPSSTGVPAFEKLNTRTTYNDFTTISLADANNKVKGGLNAVSHGSFPFSKHRPIAFGSGALNNFTFTGGPIGGTNAAASYTMAFLDGEVFATRKIVRRCTKCGWYPTLGNSECHLHKKTGGGAFEMTSRPHFHNDLFWIDPSAWKLGTGLEPVNLNLAAPEAVVTRSFGSILT